MENTRADRCFKCKKPIPSNVERGWIFEKLVNWKNYCSCSAPQNYPNSKPRGNPLQENIKINFKNISSPV
jgi:hypothetical protein